jgi:hypothetical protein
MHDEGEDRAARGLPWGFVLDPVANARAISDVQRRGLRAARHLVDQVVSNLDRVDEGSVSSPSWTTGDSDGAADPVTDLVRSWTRLVSRTMDAFEPSGTGATDGRARTSAGGGRPGRPGAPMTVDVTAGGDRGPLGLVADEKGALSRPAELWLHNPSPGRIGPLRMHVGDLRSPDGIVVPSSVLEFDPETLEVLPARAKQVVALTLTLLEPLPPGVYRSVIQVAGAPDLSIPFRLSIHPSS